MQFGFGLGFRFGGGSRGSRAGGSPVSSEPEEDREAKVCEWKRKSLGKDTQVTQVRSNNPSVVEVVIDNFAASGGFKYHCKKSPGEAVITYKYIDDSGGERQGKFTVVCNP